jgi:hypothetical protein
VWCAGDWLVICTAAQYCGLGLMKEDEMEIGKFGVRREGNRILVVIRRERGNLEYTGIDGTIILKLFSKTENEVDTLNGLVCLR